MNREAERAAICQPHPSIDAQQLVRGGPCTCVVIKGLMYSECTHINVYLLSYSVHSSIIYTCKLSMLSVLCGFSMCIYLSAHWGSY